MKQLSYSPLALAVAGVLVSSVAVAETAETADLGALSVTADRQGSKIKTNVVTTAVKDESTATDLRGLLKAEPSIDFGAGNGASQYITIRGMGQNSVDIKVDNAYTDTQTLYHQGRHVLDPSLVKIVSVQKGAGSASAGIGQTNGSIVAKTVDAYDLLKNSNKDWGFKVNGGYSDNNETSYGLTGFGKAGNFDFLVSYSMTDQGNYKPGKKEAEQILGNGKKKYYSPYTGITCSSAADPITCQSPTHPSDEVAFSALERQSYLLKTGYNLGNHRFVASHYRTDNKGVRNVREEFDWFARQRPNYRELSSENTNLEYQGKELGFADKVDANIYLMRNSRESADDSSAYGAVAGWNKSSAETTGLNVNIDKNLNDDTLFKYGVNYRVQKITPNRERTGFVHQEKEDAGVYAEVIGDIGKFTLTGGVRYDHFGYTSMRGKQVSGGALSPSMGVIFQATPALSFNAVHNYATRSPRLVDILLSGSRDVDIVDGTKAEKAKNTEVGFNFKHNNLSLDGSYFWQEVDGLLANGQMARHDGSGTYQGISNVGWAKNKGFEINARYNYKGLMARLGVADSRPEFHTYPDKFSNGTNLISFTQKQYGVLLGRTYTAGLAYRFDKPSLEIGVNHRRTDDVTGSLWGEDTAVNQAATRVGYQTTDVYANWKPFSNDKLNVNLSVNNLTDEYYIPMTSATIGVPAVGREYRIGFNYTY